MTEVDSGKFWENLKFEMSGNFLAKGFLAKLSLR
jgi:hypothetical protein